MRVFTDVVEARAKSVPAFTTKTFVVRGHKTAAGVLVAPPLVVIYPAEGIPTQERFSGPRSTQHPRWTIHIVGTSYGQVSDCTDLLKAQFIDSHGFGIPWVVAGWSVRNVAWSAPVPIQEDTDVTPSVLYQVVELSLDADPV